MMKRSIILIFILGLIGCGVEPSSKVEQVPEYDVVNRNGGIYDVKGSKPFVGDVAINSKGQEQMTKSKFAFPVGYHEFHKDKAFNFQLNRWYSMGYARFKDMEEAGQKINSFEEWKIEMLKLAEIAVSESRGENRGRP